MRRLDPQLHPSPVAFCLLAPGAPLPEAPLIGTFTEAEGTTVVLDERDARRLGLDVRFVAAWITLRIETTFDSVGLTALVSRALADAGIACNIIAAVHHDHVFVPSGSGAKAVTILGALQST